MKNSVLITGGAGFIGHHVIDYLIKNTDYNIVSLDRLDFSGNLNRLYEALSTYDSSTQKRIKIIFHDLKAGISPQVKDSIGEIKYILHLAAGSHVDRSIQYPFEFVMDNVIGTLNILEFARQCSNLERFLYFSTDEIFGPAPDNIKYKENDRYNSTNPYSASKAGGEELVVAYENTYKIPCIITHTMNVFGERQHPEKYIPLCIKKIRDEQKISIYSNPEKTKAGSRHYIHATDVADAVYFLMNYDLSTIKIEDFGGAKCHKFNIVGSQELDNLELAKLIAKYQHKELFYEMVDFHSSRPGHDLRYALDGSKMQKMGWTPSSVTDRLYETVQWTLSHSKWLN